MENLCNKNKTKNERKIDENILVSISTESHYFNFKKEELYSWLIYLRNEVNLFERNIKNSFK